MLTTIINSCQSTRYSSPKSAILHVVNLDMSQIADFGFAAFIDPTNYAHFSRRKGTEGHLTPVCIRVFDSSQYSYQPLTQEQFSSRWAFRDAERCRHIN